MVEGAGLAAIFLAENADVRLEFAEKLGSFVGGTVVDDKNLAVRRGEILRQDAVERFFDETFVVVGIDQNADERIWHSG